MNKFLFLFLTYIMNIQSGFCVVEEVSPELKEALKIHTNDPSFATIIFSLLFVICLIYITGVIYSKLNIVGAKTVKKQLEKQELTNVVVLSTTQLGQNRNLHVIEVNNKIMLIGATPNSVNLIKELTKDEIKSEIGQEKNKSVDEFDLHKKYL